MGVRTGVHGAGQITVTSFSVPPGSLRAWRERLHAAGVAFEAGEARFGGGALRVVDPSGLLVELLEGPGDERTPWLTAGGPASDHAIRGIHGVTLTVRDAGPTLELLVEGLGAELVAREGSRTRVALGGDLPGHYLEILEAPDAPAAVNGLGTVHHVALAIATDEEQLAARETLMRRGLNVTEVRDRQYFRSIYFREPGGILHEIATLPPGFTVDETLAELGSGLKLPPWEEASRAAIEKALPEVRVPGAGGDRRSAEAAAEPSDRTAAR
jgi:glyoxalase family protein